MPYAQITGWGMYVPSRVVTNDYLVRTGLDTSDEWISTRTGIKERRLVAQGEATSDMAVRAAQRALETANVDPGEVNLVIVGTCTPDHLVPFTAALVQDRLGMVNAGAFDVNAACSGFVYALAQGTAQIESGRARRVLIIGADTLSPYLDWEDRSTCVLFGDGAGAVLLQSAREPGILSTCLGSDGSGGSLLMIPAGGSRLPPNGSGVPNGDHYLKMDGRQIFRWSTQMMGRVAETAVQASGLRPGQIDLFIPHQANERIIEVAARRLGLPLDKVFVNVGRYGNTTAASIPIALCEAVEQGRVKPGDHLVLASFGAGLSWGAAVVRWGVPPARPSAWRRLRRRTWGVAASVRSAFRRQARRAGALVDRPFDRDA